MADLRKPEVLALAWSLGWRVAAGFVIGYYADAWMGTAPWFTLLFALAALVSVVRAMLASLEQPSPGDDRRPSP
jgi:F0F1-type ATP synthase assembly protein I